MPCAVAYCGRGNHSTKISKQGSQKGERKKYILCCYYLSKNICVIKVGPFTKISTITTTDYTMREKKKNSNNGGSELATWIRLKQRPITAYLLIHRPTSLSLFSLLKIFSSHFRGCDAELRFCIFFVIRIFVWVFGFGFRYFSFFFFSVLREEDEVEQVLFFFSFLQALIMAN